MHLVLFLILLFPAFIFSNPKSATHAVTEGEPSANIEGCVNAITGDFFISQDDIVVVGVEPVRLKRFYMSSNSQAGRSGWFFFQHLMANFMPPIYRVEIPEHSGTLLSYQAVFKEKKISTNLFGKYKKEKKATPFHLEIGKDTTGLTNSSRGELSARSNLKNNKVELNAEHTHFILKSPDGGERYYKKIPHQETRYHLYFLLEWERLPSGNTIHYGYDKHNRLDAIRTANHDGTKTYAWIRIHWLGSHKDNPNFDIETSDGRWLYYRFQSYGDKKEGTVYLIEKVRSPEFPKENISYHDKNTQRGPVIAKRMFPDGRTLKVEYYQPGVNDILGARFNFDEQDPRCNNVKFLFAPVGSDDKLHPIHSFIYYPEHHWTEDWDIYNHRTHYHYSEQQRLTEIKHYPFKDGQHIFSHAEKLAWGKELSSDATNLLCKSITDKNGEGLCATRYFYDDRGNVREEHVYGNLSGECPYPPRNQ